MGSPKKTCIQLDDKFKKLFSIKKLNENGGYYPYPESKIVDKDSLFFPELPLIVSEKQLQIVKSCYKYDEYYITSGCVKERKKYFDSLWKNFKPCADKHFLTEVKTNFHQRSWEMYFGNVLLDRGFGLGSQDEGPDFVVNNVGYIECVASTKGVPGKIDSVPKIIPGIVQDIPMDKMILRITQAFKEKAIDQYQKWKTKSWFDTKSPFIIAINTGDLDYPQDYLGIPLVIRALFGLHYLEISRSGDKNFSWRNEIQKGDGVPVNYFTHDSYNFVSGVVFCDRMVVSRPEHIGDDCIFVNNPFASYPVNKSFTKLFKCWEAITKENQISITKLY